MRGIRFSSAGFQTCCFADFQVGKGKLPWCAPVGKPAMRQTGNSALRREKIRKEMPAPQYELHFSKSRRRPNRFPIRHGEDRRHPLANAGGNAGAICGVEGAGLPRGPILQWLYTRRATRWEAMTNLPKALRQRLQSAYSFYSLEWRGARGRTTRRKNSCGGWPTGRSSKRPYSGQPRPLRRSQ